MNKNKLEIAINATCARVFEFSINPENTPNWIVSITIEKVDDFPIKLGTLYSNTSDNINWSNYTCTKFIKNELFELSDTNGGYKVRYDYEKLSDNQTKLTYTEWTEDDTKLSNLLDIESLVLLKSFIEDKI